MRIIWNKEAISSAGTLGAGYILGMVAGILFANLTYPFRASGAEVLGMYLLQMLEEGITPGADYLIYILKIRSGNYLFFLLAGLTGAARPAAFFGVLSMGFLGGAAGSMAVLQMGFRGMLLFLAAGIPHGLLYIPAFMGILTLAYSGNGKLIRIRHGRLKSYVLGALLCYLVLLAGIVLEAYGNPGLLRWLSDKI